MVDNNIKQKIENAINNYVKQHYKIAPVLTYVVVEGIGLGVYAIRTQIFLTNEKVIEAQCTLDTHFNILEFAVIDYYNINEISDSMMNEVIDTYLAKLTDIANNMEVN